MQPQTVNLLSILTYKQLYNLQEDMVNAFTTVQQCEQILLTCLCHHLCKLPTTKAVYRLNLNCVLRDGLQVGEGEVKDRSRHGDILPSGIPWFTGDNHQVVAEYDSIWKEWGSPHQRNVGAQHDH